MRFAAIKAVVAHRQAMSNLPHDPGTNRALAAPIGTASDYTGSVASNHAFLQVLQ
jgi:hypothetical protein